MSAPHRRPLPIGTKRTRLDDCHLDPEWLDLVSQNLREPLHRELCALVSSNTRGATDPAADRGELDEVTRALPTQNGQRSPGDVDDAEEIGLDLGSEILVRGLLDRRAVGIAGVVD